MFFEPQNMFRRFSLLTAGKVSGPEIVERVNGTSMYRDRLLLVDGMGMAGDGHKST